MYEIKAGVAILIWDRIDFKFKQWKRTQVHNKSLIYHSMLNCT